MTYLTTLTKYLTLSSGENIFYREAGLNTSPTILLLHGLPSSSHQYRNLIPILSPHYHIIAPDLPAFGFTSVPENYTYTFDNIANSIDTFLTCLRSTAYILALPVKHPGKIQAIISQNGNAYDEGLGTFWDPIKTLWASGNATSARDPLGPIVEIAATKSQYFGGTVDASAIASESYSLDQYLLDRPGHKEIQLDILYDYGTNPPLYPSWQKWMRDSQVPVLAVWGKNDPIFFYNSPNSEVHLLDGSHFIVESHVAEIGALMISFLKRHGI
ncbi:alpha/beta-hydrolase [Cucurbitaria berberidis CBS 394.84]|uniref:Alpha/beta-hydrolase n=1 Tax=Cucurbitaria berberidis CBS 394.84 TaxID=1168544 RepID=A0A9P4G6K5_9PLEO|nr:alpha/beta-hydrolase [Cucurbitaria berberidis CBS 394.84]KAF1839939.1 alpha/beta-hydrolase [Cucurbitaria berberidis CBS 394.84]